MRILVSILDIPILLLQFFDVRADGRRTFSFALGVVSPTHAAKQHGGQDGRRDREDGVYASGQLERLAECLARHLEQLGTDVVG
jgi:hypothetical protein